MLRKSVPRGTTMRTNQMVNFCLSDTTIHSESEQTTPPLSVGYFTVPTSCSHLVPGSTTTFSAEQRWSRWQCPRDNEGQKGMRAEEDKPAKEQGEQWKVLEGTYFASIVNKGVLRFESLLSVLYQICSALALLTLTAG